MLRYGSEPRVVVSNKQYYMAKRSSPLDANKNSVQTSYLQCNLFIIIPLSVVIIFLEYSSPSLYFQL